MQIHQAIAIVTLLTGAAAASAQPPTSNDLAARETGPVVADPTPITETSDSVEPGDLEPSGLSFVPAAGSIVQPANVSTSYIELFGGIGRAALTIDQSGLSASYVSGETDFDAYLATTIHTNSNGQMMLVNSNGLNQPNGIVETGGTITLDLGAPLPIDALGVWATRNDGELMSSVAVFADTDADLGNGGATLLGTYDIPDTSDGTPLGFSRVETRFLHIEVLAHGGGSFLRNGEFAARIAGDFAANCPGDANDDTVVDFNDIVTTLANWLTDYTPGTGTGTGPGDANADGVVDFNDIVASLANWLNECP